MVDLLTDALAQTRAAQERAGVHVEAVTTLEGLDDARAIFDEVWPSSESGTQVQPNLLKALVHGGGYCAAAYIDDRPVAASMGFIARRRNDRDEWQVYLHSHNAAVIDGFRDRQIGFALKTHQRAWAIEQGLATIVWTFDPLVRRNARFNLLKLGIEVRGYEVNFYGEMDDAINEGDPTDRLLAWWDVASEKAVRAAAGGLQPIDVAARRSAGASIREIVIPEDIVSERSRDRAAALAWRLQVREEFLSAFAEGYGVTGVTTSGNYVLERP